jgi:hypothetical protein
MKNFNTLFLTTLGLGLLASQAARAQQSIGNGATPARTGTMLDVNGPLATAETAVAATGTTAPTATIAAATGQARLTTGTATAGPIAVSYTSPANVGQRLMIYNSTALAAAFNSQDIPAGQAVEFVYSDSGWRSTAGGGNITATNGLTKTGNAIGLGGSLTGPTSINQNGNDFSLTGGNVGIGTTDPIQRLDVANGGIRAGAFENIRNQGAYLQWNRSGTDGETWLINQKGTSTAAGAGIRFGGSNAVATGTNTVAEWGRFTDAGNFGVVNRQGIGTNVPNARLEVRGGNRRDGTGGDAAIAFSSSPSLGLNTHRHFISTRHAPVLQDGFGGNSIDFYLNNSGNDDSFSPSPGVGNIQAVTFDNNNGEARVGIATMNPTRALDVVGNVRVRGLSGGGIVTADASGNLGLASAAALDATTASNGLTKTGTDVQLGGALTRATAVSGISATNTLSFVGAAAAEAAVTVGTADGNAGRYALGNANHGLLRNLSGSTGGGGNDIALYTSNGGSTSRLFLANNPNATGGTNLPLGQFTLMPSGYVGLGTANPTNKLHIVSSGGPGFEDDDFVFETYTVGGPGTYYRHARGTVAAPANLVAGDGIHVQGDVGFINGSFQQTAFLNTYYTGDGTTNRSYMQFGTSGAERLRIAETGNVGIGATAPNTRLSLTPSATEAKITLFDGGNTTVHYGFGVSTNQLNYDVTSGASHVFYVNSKNGSGSEVLRTNAAGTYLQTAGGPQLAISTTRGTVGSAVPANADGNVYYEVVGLENHVFGGNVVPNSDNALSLGLSGARWSTVYAANGVVQTSDSRLKTHIENSAYGLKDVLKMRPVTYNWKSQPNTNHMVGFLAQELEQVVPEAVVAPKGAGEYYGVKYEELIPVLTKAIQEQQAQIEALKTANARLQAQASGSAQDQAELQDVKASLLTLAEQVKQLQASGATATTK